MWWCVMASSEGEEVSVCLGVVGETGVEGEDGGRWNGRLERGIVFWVDCVTGALCGGKHVRCEGKEAERELNGSTLHSLKTKEIRILQCKQPSTIKD